MNKRIYTLFIFLFLMTVSAFAENSELDSLLQSLKANNKADTTTLKTLNDICRSYIATGDYDAALNYAKKAIILADNLLTQSNNRNVYKNKAKTLHQLGLIYGYKSNFSEALQYHTASLKIREEIADKQGIAASFNNISSVYVQQGNYPEALRYLFLALKIKEEIGDKKGIAASYIGVGNVYFSQGNYTEALKNYYSSLKIREEIADRKGLASAHMGIGIVYFQQKNYKEALSNYAEALKINEEFGNKNGIASSYLNIGDVYNRLEKQAEAMKNYFAAVNIMKEIGDIDGLANARINIGCLYAKQGNYKEALINLNDGLRMAKEIGSLDNMKSGYEGLAELYEHKKDYAKAHEYYKQYITYRDSLVNEDNTKKTVQAQMQFEFDKKDAIAKAEIDKQRLILNVFIAGFVLMLFLAFYIYRGYKNKKKANEIITGQKIEVEYQKELVDLKNREITDSINYAKRIQLAILPSLDTLKGHFAESFVCYKPKDIVSGDFYTFIKKDNFIVIAVADCTGHGVPGALMSMVGSNILNQIVGERNVTNPSEILRRLNVGIIRFLKQAENRALDGMDIAVCTIDLNTSEVEFAGANRPLCVVKEDASFHEFKPDKRPIGGYYDNASHNFTNQKIQLNKGDSLYLFSDGYADQFGGDVGKKMMTKRFKETLVGMQALDMKEQELHLSKFFEEWKGTYEQVDDVLVMGLKI